MGFNINQTRLLITQLGTNDNIFRFLINILPFLETQKRKSTITLLLAVKTASLTKTKTFQTYLQLLDSCFSYQ